MLHCDHTQTWTLKNTLVIDVENVCDNSRTHIIDIEAVYDDDDVHVFLYYVAVAVVLAQ